MKTGKLDCRIADLTVQLPDTPFLRRCCQQYLCDPVETADITILQERYNSGLYEGADLSQEMLEYYETARQFNYFMLQYDGFYLHASAVEMDGRAYLFSGPSGMGKSTHTRSWLRLFGDRARVFNDDKPTLRCLEDGWYAYGTPWCGKDHINQNVKAPLAGICFLQQAAENKIVRLSHSDALHRILAQSSHKFVRMERMEQMLSLLDRLIREVPVFLLENLPDDAAARLSYETMRRAAMETEEGGK